MKVVVANPPWPGEGYGARTNVRWPHRRGDKILAFPIYLAYASSVLKKSGFDTYAIDAVQKEYGIEKFAEKIKEINPEVVLLEVSTPSIKYDLKTAKQIKKELPECFVVFCGPHATYFHKRIIEKYGFVDACIRREFEHVIKDLCVSIKNNKNLKEVKGITYRDGGVAKINEDAQPIENLDELPFPDRASFKIEDYQQAFFSGKKTASMISSRGCPYQCTFCLWPETMYGRRHRTRSAKNVVDEIELLINQHGVDEIFFDDDTFAISKKRMQDISKEIIQRNIKTSWICMGRVNTVDKETLELMKKAGCIQIFYGFESGSEEILDSIKKGITREQSINAVRLTQKAGLVAGGSFVFGMPKESKKTVRETIKFAKKLKADYVQFTLAAPFPGTKFYEEAKQKNLLDITSWEDLDGTHGAILKTEHLSKEELAGVIRKAYLSYYTSPGVIWQSIKKMGYDKKRVFRGFKSLMARLFYYKK